MLKYLSPGRPKARTIAGLETPTLVKGSCEKVAEAKEEKVQWNQSGGRGFPKAMVPNTRDEASDGIVDV